MLQKTEQIFLLSGYTVQNSHKPLTTFFENIATPPVAYDCCFPLAIKNYMSLFYYIFVKEAASIFYSSIYE